MNATQLERLYYRLAIIILGCTAAAKFASIFGDEIIVETTEPLLGLSYRQIFIVSSLVELAICGCLASNISRVYKLSLLGVFIATGLTYHTIHDVLEVPTPCPCLGNLFQWSPWISQHDSAISVSLLITLGVGLGGVALAGYLADRHERAAS